MNKTQPSTRPQIFSKSFLSISYNVRNKNLYEKPYSEMFYYFQKGNQNFAQLVMAMQSSSITY